MTEKVETVYFGPAGNSDSFAAEGHKSVLEVPMWLSGRGLNAFEYQCGRGVNIGREKAEQFGVLAREYGIRLSIHAPYYISMSSVDEEKRLNSLNYILQSCEAAKNMGADRIIFHSGSAGKIERNEAMGLALDTMARIMEAIDQNGYSGVTLCPETMGKINQLGSLEEVISLCSVDERLIPCIDFGHLNARSGGGIKTAGDYEAIFDALENGVGKERTRLFHAHFSKIEYSKGGEVRHLNFDDEIYGPDFGLCAKIIADRGYKPVLICESAGMQAEDAAEMMRIYRSFL